MKLHPEEMALARAYTASADFEGLTDDQMLKVMTRGRQLFQWFKTHRVAHNLISTSVLLFLFAGDYWAQIRLPHWLLGDGPGASTSAIVVAAIAAGALHSWLMYSLGVFSMHEGAAHQIDLPSVRADQPHLPSRLVESLPRGRDGAQAVLDPSHGSPCEVRVRGRCGVPELREAQALLADVPAARLRFQLRRLHRPPAARPDARPAPLGLLGDPVQRRVRRGTRGRTSACSTPSSPTPSCCRTSGSSSTGYVSSPSTT